MYRQNKDSNRIMIATISLCVVAIALVCFTVMVYKGKRSHKDDFFDMPPGDYVSQSDAASPSDVQNEPQTEVSSQTEESTDISSADTPSAETQSTVDTNDILNPDYNSEYYVVVYTGNQMIVVYKKDENGKYTQTSYYMKCSTGALDTTPTKEGVYSIQKKEKWVSPADKEYAQYGCLISKEENYYICSASYRKKTAWTMIDGRYESIGTAVTGGSIQLCVRDANWIYVNIPEGTQVNVVNRNGPDLSIKELPKKIKLNGGWDPTDKWARGNPYFS